MLDPKSGKDPTLRVLLLKQLIGFGVTDKLALFAIEPHDPAGSLCDAAQQDGFSERTSIAEVG